MEHMKELHSGEQAGTAVSVQAEQILSLLERRGIVEDQSITSKKAREAEQELRRNMYHNTQMMLRHYRDIVWALECFPQQVAEELDRPLHDLDALLSAVDTQIAMGNANWNTGCSGSKSPDCCWIGLTMPLPCCVISRVTAK